MTMFEYAKKAYQSMKDKPREERWQYFLDYYKWYAITILLVIALLIQGIVFITTRKETVFSGVLVDGSESFEAETYMQDLEEHLQINTKKEKIFFQTNISLDATMDNNRVDAFQRIVAGFTTQSTDFLTAEERNFATCAYHTMNMFADLRDCLDAETLAKLDGRIYYIDQSIIDQAREKALPEDLVIPDPHAPETMIDPVPVGINITDCKEFCSTYYLLQEDLYLGIAVNTTRLETVLELLEFLGI